MKMKRRKKGENKEGIEGIEKDDEQKKRSHMSVESQLHSHYSQVYADLAVIVSIRVPSIGKIDQFENNKY